MATKAQVLELLSQALEQAANLKIDGYTVEDTDAEEAFSELFASIDKAIETVGYYAD